MPHTRGPQHVNLTQLSNGLEVSTVLLGKLSNEVDPFIALIYAMAGRVLPAGAAESMRSGKPYESIVFDGQRSVFTTRYDTREEAEKGHEVLVKQYDTPSATIN